MTDNKDERMGWQMTKSGEAFALERNWQQPHVLTSEELEEHSGVIMCGGYKLHFLRRVIAPSLYLTIEALQERVRELEEQLERHRDHALERDERD